MKLTLIQAAVSICTAALQVVTVHAGDAGNAAVTSTSSTMTETGGPDRLLPSFALRPTALLHPAHRSLNLNTGTHGTTSTSTIHPHVAAVYAGLNYIRIDEREHEHERMDTSLLGSFSEESEQNNGKEHQNDNEKSNINSRRRLVEEHNASIRHFNDMRQYSRFEHARRNQRQQNDVKNDQSPVEEQLRFLSHGYSKEHMKAINYKKATTKAKQESKQGGTYNSYQTAPLSQGIGTHYATVWVGSPMPQPQTLIVDTGSHRTAFPCNPCNNCGEKYHANQYFNPEYSKSFHPLGCEECVGDDISCDHSHQCPMKQSYSEGSSWRAFQARDFFFCGHNHPSKILVKDHDYHAVEYDTKEFDKKYALPFVFGCQTSLTGLFRTQLADGIMGMSAMDNTLTKELFDQGMVEHNMFSMCFKRDVAHDKDGVTAGVLTLGGVDKRLERSPMVYAGAKLSEEHGWYAVHVKKIWMRVGGGLGAKEEIGHGKGKPEYILISENEKGMNAYDGVIVDSGTTDTYLLTSMGSQFRKEWKKVTGYDYRNKRMKLSRKDILTLPTILVQMSAYDQSDESVDRSIDVNDVVGLAGTKLSKDSPRDIILAIPPTHYMEYSGLDVDNEEGYTPRLYFSESSGGVLGANAMMNHDVLFDWENSRVGFAESNCDYDELMEDLKIVNEKDKDKHGDGASTDCVLGEARIEKSCVETVDSTSCSDESENKKLKGKIKWEMVVKAEGFGEGESCTSVAEKRFKDEKSLSVFATCIGGVCSVLSDCFMTCKQAKDKDDENDPPKDSSKPAVPEAGGKACPNEGWGSCQSSCVQSKIISKRRHDGECHIDHVETRNCHIDSCGQNDPCMVPFLVHAIVLFAGMDPNLWGSEDEEIFVDNFASTMNMEKEPGDELFNPGDVKILSVGPWKANEDELYDGDIDKAMQIVLEVSIYNDKAILPSTGKNVTNAAAQAAQGIVNVITGPEHATCAESDIYPLSQTALDVHLEMKKDEFMRLLIQNIRGSGHTYLANSIFSSISDEGESVDKSTVLTSWTIKTEVNGLFQGGTFQGINKETVKNNTSLVIATSLVLFAICYCGVCFGSFCTKRRYKLQEAKNALMRRVEEQRREQERGQYAEVDSDLVVSEREIELGNIESFQDHPTSTDEDLDFANASEKKRSNGT